MKERIRAAALELGFARAGFAPVSRLPHADFYRRWLERGYAAEMSYLEREPETRALPTSLMPEARAALVVLAAHDGPPRTMDQGRPDQGRVARYARGADYHHVIREALQRLAVRMEGWLGEDLPRRLAVDTSPLLERELAVAAGLGFIGHNAMLITPGLGSYTLIGVMLLPLELPPDPPMPARCGSCTRCLDACPTAALRAPRLLDARRCVSYLTIEHRGDVPDDLAGSMGPWIFGCDACQEVCPYNARAPGRAQVLPGLAAQRPNRAMDLPQLMTLGKGEHLRLVKGTALRRTPRHQLRRNGALAAGALGKACTAPLVQALEQAARDHRPEVIHAARQSLALTGREVTD